MLYPVGTVTREIKECNGLWEFAVDREGVGRAQKWFEKPLAHTRPVPVPASYNDLFNDPSIRDHVGTVWYEKNVHVPVSWKGSAVVLRVGSATHHATVWVNGAEVMTHRGGFLPFEADVSAQIDFGKSNRITVEVDNRLDRTCLPQGEVVNIADETRFECTSKEKMQKIFFDFFNYSGIHRPVRLLRLPRERIEDITVTTELSGNSGKVNYTITTGASAAVRVVLLDAAATPVAEDTAPSGTLTAAAPHLWEPGNPYLYTLRVTLQDDRGNIVDTYDLPVGIRSIKVEGDRFLLNGKPFYFTGFGKHEDFHLNGRGFDEVVMIKDFNLLSDLGANSFRTSHYPYAEEIMRMADRMGIVVIDEVPAVGMNDWTKKNPVFFTEGKISEETLAHHLEVTRELIARDKNHACVVMWSVGNEAATWEEGAERYFKEVIDEVRRCDPTRPVTMVEAGLAEDTRVSQYVDVVCVNQYIGWYELPGRLDVTGQLLETWLRKMHDLFGKPIIVTEFGTDTIAGLHAGPSAMFTEEFQIDFFRLYFEVYDRLDFVVGEQIWNFADFMTKQGTARIMGNKKGVFTRERHPKSCVPMLRDRWQGIARKAAPDGQ